MPPLHGGSQGFESPRLHPSLLIAREMVDSLQKSTPLAKDKRQLGQMRYGLYLDYSYFDLSGIVSPARVLACCSSSSLAIPVATSRWAPVRSALCSLVRI